MRNLGILLKTNVNRMLGTFQRKRKINNTGLVLLCLSLYIGICAIFGLQVFSLFKEMKSVKEIPLFNSIQIAVMILIITSFQSLTAKSKTADSDLLLSLPIKKYEIVVSKTISKYLLGLLLISMVMIPTLVLYSVVIELSAGVILWGMLLIFLLPLLLVGVNYIIDFLLVRLFNRIKYANLVKTIFAIVLFGGVVAIYVYNSMVMGTITISSVNDYLNSNIFVGWCVRVMINNDIMALLYICLILFTLTAIGVLLYSSIFGKTFSSYKKIKNKVIFSNNGSFSTLIKKELKKYFSTPIYMFNTIISPILMIMLTVYLLIKGNNVFNIFGFTMQKQTMFAILTMIYLFLTAMTCASCVSISLEGKYLWILKCHPINVKQVLFSKSVLNMIIFVPVHLLTSISISISLSATINDIILFITLPLLLNIIISFGGTYINLLLPKLNWDNEAQVVKSSLSVIVSMLISIILAVIPLIFKLCNVELYLAGYIILLIYLTFAIITITLLMTHGVKKFNKLNF